MVTMSTYVSASLSKNVYLVIVYVCAKFGAFIKKCTIFLVSHYTSSHSIYTNEPFHYVTKMTVACFVITLTSKWFSLSYHCKGIPNLLKCWLQTACSCIIDILNSPGTYIKSTYAK